MLNYLKEFRSNKGLTQKAMAQRLGITTSHYTKIELGTRVPSFEVLRKFKQSYGEEFDINMLFK